MNSYVIYRADNKIQSIPKAGRNTYHNQRDNMKYVIGEYSYTAQLQVGR